MSKKYLKFSSTKESLNITTRKTEITCKESPIVIIPINLFGVFYMLHTKYKGREWSGYIFYDVKGDSTDFNNLECTIIDFVLLDIGSPGFTSIDPTGEQIVNILLDRPHLMGKKMGCLHTHHGMNLFFSGTDKDTLLNSSEDFDFFLSVIVNHTGHPIAKISRAGTIETVKKTTFKLDSQNKFVMFPVTEVEDVVFTYDCNVVIENPIEKEINVLEKREAEEAKRKSLIPKTIGFHSPQYGPSYMYKQKEKPEKDSWSWEDHNQLDLFNTQTEESEIGLVDQFKGLNIKEKSIEYYKMALVGTNIGTKDLSLVQAQEEFHTNCKDQQLTLKEIKERVEEDADIFFDDVFGEDKMSLNLLKEIQIHLSIICNNNDSKERMVSGVLTEYLNNVI